MRNEETATVGHSTVGRVLEHKFEISFSKSKVRVLLL